MTADSSENWAENDSFEFDDVKQKIAESFSVRDESTEGDFESVISDGIGRGYKRNGTLRRRSSVYRSSKGISDPLAMHGGCVGFSDEMEVSDSFNIGRRWWYWRRGIYSRDSSITRKSGVLEAI